MTLELLLWVSLGINAVTLICSYLIIKRFKKISKLTGLIYDHLAVTKVDLSSAEVTSDNDRSRTARFDEQLTQHLSRAEQLSADPLLEPQRHPSTEASAKTATRAESHLIKVLQAKYASQDEESSPPASK